jgi:hypothetical protein
MLGMKQLVKRVPGVRVAYRSAQYALLTLRRKPVDVIFTEIFHGNKFGGTESASGPGSDVYQTRVVRDELPIVIYDYDVHKMLDIPCGDFHWMKHVNMKGVDYTGADIVTDLIRQNSHYETSNIHFCTLDLIKDRLPKVDLVFCRDCLVHLSDRDAIRALRNIFDSGSNYLLTTTFTRRQRNHNIATGQWRPLNLEVIPFCLSSPLKVINEGCTEEDGAYSDKSLGLWRIADIGDCIAGPMTKQIAI